MTRFFLLLAVLSAGAFTASATEKDSLVRWKDLKFTSTFEKDAYGAFLHSNIDFIKLFVANSPDPEFYAKHSAEKIDFVVNEIEKSGNLTKKNARKIKYIYDLVHARFLTKYESENRFYEIIKNGNYNCVTATALFAIVFERLKIPYRIIELPTHVYLVAYPDSDNIKLETTAPIFGFNTYSTEFQAQFVNNLKKQKIIAADDATQTVELFNKHFFGSGSVSLTELVGIHYMNDAIFYQGKKEESSKSYEQMTKAYLLWPSERSEYVLILSSIDRLNDSKLDPLIRAEIIGLLARTGTTHLTTENILAEFYRLSNQVLDKNNDRPLYAKCFDIIMANVTDTEVSNELTYHYNYENGRVYYNQGNFARAKPFFKKAMEIRPRSSEVGTIFVSCLGQSFRNERRNRAMLDTLIVYKNQFPVLEEYPNFMSMLAIGYASYFAECFENNDAATGEKNREQFEQLMAKEQISVLSYDVIGRAYSEAAAYYFKKGQKTKAKALIDKGLQFAPDNQELKMRKQMIN